MSNQSKTRQDYLESAEWALRKAAVLAEHAESAAHSNERRHTAPGFAAAGSLYADIARGFTAIAQAADNTAKEA